MKKSHISSLDLCSFERRLSRALSQWKDGMSPAVKKGVALSAVALASVQGVPGCDPASGNVPLSTLESAVFTQGDWPQREGIRDASMVSYLGDYWTHRYDCNPRGGCMSVDVFLKVKVKPVAHASLSAKRVGVVFQTPSSSTPETALGTFFTALQDGFEEWHVKVSRRAWDASLLAVNVFYQDGAGKTYYDDNNGKYHAIAYASATSVIYHDYAKTNALVNKEGVFGRIEVTLADLSFAKDLRMVATTDSWKTVKTFKMGQSGQTNVWYWVEDLDSGYERWAIDLEVREELGPEARFEYAVVYRHGGSDGARGYEFWDNRGGTNHVIEQISLLP